MLQGDELLGNGMALTTIVFVGLFCLLLLAVPTVFFLMTLQRALSRCAPSSRIMTPGQVWLGMVPIFSVIWTFIVVNAVSESLHNEFVRRGIVEEPQPGRTLGLAYAVLALLCAIPFVNFVAWIPMAICWILYWVKIAGFSQRIAVPFAAPVGTL